MPTYIQKRGTKYYFNRRAPEPLFPGFEIELGDRSVIVGKNQFIRFALDTADKKAAGVRARKYTFLVDEAAQRLTALRSRTHNLDAPTTAEIAYAAATMRAKLLASDEDSALAAVASVLGGDTDIREPDRYSWSTADLPPASTAGQALLLERLGRLACQYLYQTSKKTITSVGPELLPFADTFRVLIADFAARASGQSVPTPPLPTKQVPDCSWSDALTYYFEQRTPAPKTREIYATAWGSLEKHAQCAPAALLPDQVVSFRDNVLRKDLAAITAKNRLGTCAAIWRENCAVGRIPRGTDDPFTKLTVRVPRGEGSGRKLFSDDELTEIFRATPLSTLRSVSVHAGYWLPMLAVYYGARLEELTGIEVADIVDTATGVSFWIRPNSTRDIKGHGPASRCLPLHPLIRENGFEQYCRAAQSAGVKMLFPSLASSRTFGEEFVLYCQALLQPLNGRLVGMHCFRHNWETAKRNATPNFNDSAARYMLGRVIDAGSAGAYGAAAGQPKILAELSKITYGLKHRKAPVVRAGMLQEQEKSCQDACRAGKQRAAERLMKKEAKAEEQGRTQ